MLSMLDDRIAVIPVEDPPKVGSLWVPDTAKRRAEQGVIKYRGENVKELKVGDHVLFSGYTGTRISYQDEGHLIVMKETDVLALLSGSGEIIMSRSQVTTIFKNAFNHILAAKLDYDDSACQALQDFAEAFEAELDAFDNTLVEF